ncbi:hypothetical protein [Cryobacterium sp. Y11]|uniref:hypothetical protein n=1 Tax=Cryobacterium sp. Y11 TaxID=2045016 RepID=UPI000CE41171|nr:hypothetical protein [Cryobacterium sp. Y11]
MCGDESLGSGGKAQRPDCHELWVFEDRGGVLVQRLDRLVALCKGCHAVQHTGLASINGTLDLVALTLQRVNGWTAAAAESDIKRAFDRYAMMNALAFDLDLTLLADQIQVAGHSSLLIAADDRKALGNSYFH